MPICRSVLRAPCGGLVYAPAIGAGHYEGSGSLRRVLIHRRGSSGTRARARRMRRAWTRLARYRGVCAAVQMRAVRDRHGAVLKLRPAATQADVDDPRQDP